LLYEKVIFHIIIGHPFSIIRRPIFWPMLHLYEDHPANG